MAAAKKTVKEEVKPIKGAVDAAAHKISLNKKEAKIVADFLAQKNIAKTSGDAIKAQEVLVLPIMEAVRAKLIEALGQNVKSFKIDGLTVSFADKFSDIKLADYKQLQADLKAVLDDAEYKAITKCLSTVTTMKLDTDFNDPKSLKEAYETIDQALYEAVVKAVAEGKVNLDLGKELRSLVVSAIFVQYKGIKVDDGMDDAIAKLPAEKRVQVSTLLKQSKATIKS